MCPDGRASRKLAVRKQRDKWVVRVDGIDTATGKHRPRQLGTYASQRSALTASREHRAETRRTDPNIERGLGAIPLERLDRDDVADWINALANAGTLSRRSGQICRNVLRASLADAVEEGLIPRSPAARVALPRTVAKPVKEKVVQAWGATDVDRFLAAIADIAEPSGSNSGCSTASGAARFSRSDGTTSIPRVAHFG
jgi:hypothetical protein